MVILTEGVHNGSSGPVYYGPDEMSKTPAAWDHKPIVVYHPELNGEGISACNSVVINQRKVGIMMNTTFESKPNRIKSEAWIEQPRAEVVDPRIMAAITANEMMELSTGVFIDNEPTPGEWNGEKYTAIARNFRPDHLALLPDKLGACSIADGAGLMRNAERANKPGFDKLKAVMKELGLATNEMSYSNISDTLRDSLRAKYGITQDNGPLVWVCDVYSNFVIYEYDNKLFRLSYSSSDTGITLGSEKPVEVKRVTEYRTVEGAFVGNQDQTKQSNMNAEEKKIAVDAIVANKESGWVEADRTALLAMNDKQLTTLAKAATPESKEKPPVVINKEKTPVDPPTVTTVTVTKEPTKPATLEEYVSSAPPEIQEVLRNSTQLLNEEKTKLVATITANKNNTFTKEYLDQRPLGELRGMARLCAMPAQSSSRPAADYSGMAPITDNTSGDEPVLQMPVMNFSKEKK